MTKIKYCPNCGSKNNSAEEYCEKCQNDFNEKYKSVEKKNIIGKIKDVHLIKKIIFAGLSILLIIFGVGFIKNNVDIAGEYTTNDHFYKIKIHKNGKFSLEFLEDDLTFQYEGQLKQRKDENYKIDTSKPMNVELKYHEKHVDESFIMDLHEHFMELGFKEKKNKSEIILSKKIGKNDIDFLETIGMDNYEAFDDTLIAKTDFEDELYLDIDMFYLNDEYIYKIR